MLADPALEAVIIATADAFHVPLALQAVQAGKHVLIEKPLSHSVPECQTLLEAAVQRSVHVQIGHMKRFDPGIQTGTAATGTGLSEGLAITKTMIAIQDSVQRGAKVYVAEIGKDAL